MIELGLELGFALSFYHWKGKFYEKHNADKLHYL